MASTSKPWWKDPRRVDPITERQQSQPVTQRQVMIARVLLVGLFVFGIVAMAAFSLAFVVFLVLPVVLLVAQPQERRNAILARRPTQ